MGTKTYLPTKAMQEATDAKIDAAKVVVDATKAVADSTDNKADDALIRLAKLQAQVNAMEDGFATSRLATITLTLNAPGAGGEVPADEAVKAEILKGAKFVLLVNGNEYPYEAAIDTLSNATATVRVYVSDGAKVGVSYAGAALGTSTTCAYAVAAKQLFLRGGETISVSLVTKKVTADDGDTVELFRAQPYSANPSSATDAKLKAGSSYLGIRVTNASGTTTRFGRWNADRTAWTDETLVKVSVWNVPKNADGTPGTPVERVISDVPSSAAANWQPIENYLNCLKNAKVGTVTFKNGDAEIAGDCKMVRYDKLYVKTTFAKMNMPVEQEDGTYQDEMVDCVVKWYANSALSGYHLHPLFVKYERTADGVYAETECAHGYIARYPVGNTVNVTVDGASKTVPIWKSGTGREYTMGKRSVCAANFRNLNLLTATLSFDGEEAETILPDAENRTWGAAGTAEISFLQSLAYLYFGVNVQGQASTTDTSLNLFPGICTSAVGATTNGDTDFVLAAGKMTGAVDTASCFNSITFLGVEDALWSSTGWDWDDLTLVTRRELVANADGTVASDEVTASFLFCQDPSLVCPDEGTDLTDETSTPSTESQSFEAVLKARGYRETQFGVPDSGSMWYRAGVDDSAVLRDVCLPAKVQDQHNLNAGACDQFYRGGTPNEFAFKTNLAYAVGDYVKYSNSLYKCVSAHAAGEWAASDFELVTGDSAFSLKRRSYWRFALGAHRRVGSSLGVFCLSASNGLAAASGNVWGARPLLRKVS